MSRRSISSRLYQFTRNYPVVPFDWATHNCAHFVQDWRVFCGQECASISLPPFAGVEDTRKFFVENNASLEGLVTDISGMQRIEPQYATPGCIALFTMPKHDMMALGIYDGPRTIFLTADGTLQSMVVLLTAAWVVSYVPEKV